MSGRQARLNPEYLPKAREALKGAKDNLTAARAAFNEGATPPAAASLIDAGEEVAKALLCYAAYEGFVTFDSSKADNPYLPLR